MRKLLRNPFVQGGVYLTATNFIIGFLNYLFNIGAARILGPEGYGNITTLFAYLGILTIPLNAFTSVLIQKIGAKGDSGKVFAKGVERWTFQKIGRWWFVFFAPLLLTPFMPSLTNLEPFVAYSIIPLVLISIISTMYDGIFNGLQIFFWYSVINILTISVKLLGLGAGYFASSPLIWLILFFNCSVVLKVVFNKILFNKNVKDISLNALMPLTKRVHKVLVDRQMLLSIGSIAAVALLNNVDIIYAKKIFTAEDAGLFAGWALFAKIIYYALGPLLGLSYIFFSNKKTVLQHQLVLIGGLIGFVIVGVIANLGYGYFDNLLIKTLFGPKFLSLLPFLEWAALFGIGYVMVSFMNGYFLAKSSKATLILPITLPLYVIGLLVYARSMANLIFLDTTFIFFVLTLYLIAFFRDRIVFLFQSK